MNDLDRRTILAGGAIGLAAASVAAAPAAAQQTQTFDAAKPLAGKVAFVTGGARGIGRGAALELARAGASVAIFDVATPEAFPALPYKMASKDDLAETERMLEADGARALALTGDVRDLEALKAAMARTKRELGGLDIVFANAGINIATDNVETYTPKMFDVIHAVNVGGVAKTIKAASEALPKPGGRIVVTTSREGRAGTGNFIYSSSKWAAAGVMKNAALNLGKDGITVNAVAPGPVDTMMAYRSSEGVDSEENRAAANEAARKLAVLPVGMSQPEDVGRAVAFLASPLSDHISGVTIDVNAGRSGQMLG